MSRLLSIWFKLFLTTLDILYYTIRLHLQRFIFWLQDIVIVHRSSRTTKVETKPKNGSLEEYDEYEALHNSSIPYKGKEDTHYPYCETP